MKPSNTTAGGGSKTRPGAGAQCVSRLQPLVPLLLLALGTGCGGKIPPTFYYQLHLPEPAQPQAPARPETAVVRQFNASEMLTQDRIVYRPSPEEVGFYEYHRWAEDPRTTVTNSFVSHLRRRGTFSKVVGYDGRTQSDYLVRGRIERLEEVDYGGGVTVHVKLTADLVKLGSREAVWQGTSESSETVSVGEVRNVVSQMSRAVQASIEKLASDLDAFVRSGSLAHAESTAGTRRGQD